MADKGVGLPADLAICADHALQLGHRVHPAERSGILAGRDGGEDQLGQIATCCGRGGVCCQIRDGGVALLVKCCGVSACGDDGQHYVGRGAEGTVRAKATAKAAIGVLLGFEVRQGSCGVCRRQDGRDSDHQDRQN